MHSAGQLEGMFTDLWIKPGSVLKNVNARSADRYAQQLWDARIKNYNTRFLYQKLREKLPNSIEQDQLFDRLVAGDILKGVLKAPVFFGYSYSSGESMRASKKMGITTVLGQINPGPVEADMVVEEYRKYAGGKYKPFVPDEAYWDRWRNDLLSADKIIVNSRWSADLLRNEIKDANKIAIVPLAFETTLNVPAKEFRTTFTRTHPIRVLYLGGLEIRKGFHILLDAMKQLINEPVILEVVGMLKGPDALLKDLPSNVKYHGAVATGGVSSYYANADVFIFPTLSDGFGLTLLEAQAHRLPIISSHNCAPIVTHMENGIVLRSVTSVDIAGSIRQLINEPMLLQKFSSQAVSMKPYTISRLATNLLSVVS